MIGGDRTGLRRFAVRTVLAVLALVALIVFSVAPGEDEDDRNVTGPVPSQFEEEDD